VSLRLRLLLATSAILVVALVAADVGTYAALERFLYNQTDQSLQQAHASVEASVTGQEPGPESHGPEPEGAPGGGVTSGAGAFCPEFEGMSVQDHGLQPGTVIEVLSSKGKDLYRCAVPILGSNATTYPVLPAHITGFAYRATDPNEFVTYFTAPPTSGDDGFRARASVLRAGPAKGDQLVVAVPLGSTVDILGRLRLLELAITSAAVVGSLLIVLWSLRHFLRPLRQIEQTAEEIAGGNFGERVPGDAARTEVGQVARALNVMLERVEETVSELRESETRMRRFVADASHELRTPIAAVSAYAELFERGADQRPEDLARVIRGIRLESARMGHLVDDLLLLARLDEGRPLEHRPVDLTRLAADAVETSAALGPQWPVRLMAARPVEVVGDELRLRQVLDNLLANARTHCPAGTEVTVTVSEMQGRATVEVADNGPGLSAEDAARIFDRFYRADPSRSRAQGGAGLGLSIVSSIVGAHGGTVAAAPRPGGGSLFTMVIPRGGSPVPDETQLSEGAPRNSSDSAPTHSRH